MTEKEDPVSLHKEANTLYDLGKYDEATEKFLRASELYNKTNNFFDSTSMLYKAGECAYMLKDYETAVERFLKSADMSFSKGLDRFGVSALEYVRDCYNAMNKKPKAKQIEKKIKEEKKKLEASF
jgi:tetratricopeptide (TPR) repeat protein